MWKGGKTRTSGQGRPKGSKNKATKAREEAIAQGGLTPLEYMLQKLRDPQSEEKDRQWAAQNAAPYVHPRLSQVDSKISGKVDIRAWMNSLGDPD